MPFIVAHLLWLFLNVIKIVRYDYKFLKVGKIFVKVYIMMKMLVFNPQLYLKLNSFTSRFQGFFLYF